MYNLVFNINSFYNLLMNYNKLLACVFLILVVGVGESFAWGKLGHATIAALAERHLTDSARKNVDKYLNGESIVKYASWMDAVRRTPEYRHTSGWHSTSVTSKGKHSMWSKKYRVYEGLGTEIEKMRDYRSMTDSAVAVGIKIIVHLIGDMHCPGHTFFKGTSQGFGFKVFGKDFLFHKFWDSGLLGISRKWSAERYASWLDKCCDEEMILLMQGSLEDWIEENAGEVRKIYDWLEPGRNYNTKESLDIVMKASELSDSQMRKAGYRLAHVLNMIFDSGYSVGALAR